MDITTKQKQYRVARLAVTADDTPLDGTTAGLTYMFEDMPEIPNIIEIQNTEGAVEVIFTGTDAADETCAFKLYAYREGGPAKLAFDGIVTLGTAVAPNSELYGDTITGTAYWPTTIAIVDSAVNRIASLWLDFSGYKYLYVEVLPTTGTVTSITAHESGY